MIYKYNFDTLISYSCIFFHIYRLNYNIIRIMRLMRIKDNHFFHLVGSLVW